jgi:polar amino acid transport system substrate-binding protein
MKIKFRHLQAIDALSWLFLPSGKRLSVTLGRHILLPILLLQTAYPLNADELTFGVSFSIPPYVIEQDDSGLELELLREALKVKGHRVKVEYLPVARTFLEITEGKLDGIINVKPGMLENVFYSDVVISFQNCAISLTKNQYRIDSIGDLVNKQVVAFQRATILLGEEFGQMAAANPHYQEIARQLLQINLLLKRRIEVIVMDINIFHYYRKQAHLLNTLNKEELLQEVSYHKIFPPTDYRFAFRSETHRNDFNIGLAQIAADGTRERLFAKYQDQMTLDFSTSPAKPAL